MEAITKEKVPMAIFLEGASDQQVELLTENTMAISQALRTVQQKALGAQQPVMGAMVGRVADAFEKAAIHIGNRDGDAYCGEIQTVDVLDMRYGLRYAQANEPALPGLLDIHDKIVWDGLAEAHPEEFGEHPFEALFRLMRN